LKKRQDWFGEQLDLDPRKLVFIDETGASTNLARKGVDGGLNPRLSGGALKVGTNFAVDLLAARWRVDRRLSTP